ncbi:hypothetical protein EVAR_58539_1 [Eumeta japonica]|uniref:Uncharacterized protein n=1 Tax=Eumeta variegata TaxID=151549 RepID=A0A4C1Z5Q0_EUMVA|nr:hypothetical protein EVAR_58539_1 [Eumeta japonica]
MAVSKVLALGKKETYRVQYRDYSELVGECKKQGGKYEAAWICIGVKNRKLKLMNFLCAVVNYYNISHRACLTVHARECCSLNLLMLVKIEYDGEKLKENPIAA